MAAKLVFFLTAFTCLFTRGESQYCYSCLLMNNRSDAAVDFDADCGSVDCSSLGGCSRYHIKTTHLTTQGQNETQFINFYDCGPSFTRCRPVNEATISEHSALASYIRQRQLRIMSGFGEACDCTENLCNSAPLWLPSNLITWFCVLIMWFST
ncbi:uncharacterized protein [Diadema antillarum]|uniref:uncharacterized protein n=1 Tax=Diadema antillarum TaxID=105358 RepID=UPI003A8994FD